MIDTWASKSDTRYPEPTFEDLQEDEEVNHVLVDRSDDRKAATG